MCIQLNKTGMSFQIIMNSDIYTSGPSARLNFLTDDDWNMDHKGFNLTFERIPNSED